MMRLELNNLNAAIKKQAICQLGHTEYVIKLQYCDDSHKYYRTYGGEICGTSRKIYFVELKQPVHSGLYHFHAFKDLQYNHQTPPYPVLFINFHCPAGTELTLPDYMECYALTQLDSVSTKQICRNAAELDFVKVDINDTIVSTSLFNANTNNNSGTIAATKNNALPPSLKNSRTQLEDKSSAGTSLRSEMQIPINQIDDNRPSNAKPDLSIPMHKKRKHEAYDEDNNRVTKKPRLESTAPTVTQQQSTKLSNSDNTYSLGKPDKRAARPRQETHSNSNKKQQHYPKHKSHSSDHHNDYKSKPAYPSEVLKLVYNYWFKKDGQFNRELTLDNVAEFFTYAEKHGEIESHGYAISLLLTGIYNHGITVSKANLSMLIKALMNYSLNTAVAKPYASGILSSIFHLITKLSIYNKKTLQDAKESNKIFSLETNILNAEQIGKIIHLISSTTKSDEQALANSLWCLGRYSAFSIDYLQNVQAKDISLLINNLADKRPNEIEINMTFNALGQILRAKPEILIEVNPKKIYYLIERTFKFNPTPDVIVSILYCLKNFIRACPQLVKNVDEYQIKDLVKTAIRKTPQTHNAIKILYLISYFTKFQPRLTKHITSEAINDLLKQCVNKPTTTERVKILQSLAMLCYEASYLLSDSVHKSIENIFHNLLTNHKPDQSLLILTIHALGRLADQRADLLIGIDEATIANYVYNLELQRFNWSEVTNILWCLSRFALHKPKILTFISPATVKRIVDHLTNSPVSNDDSIKSIISSLGNIANNYPHLISALQAEHFERLFQACNFEIKKFSELGHLFFGLSKLLNNSYCQAHNIHQYISLDQIKYLLAAKSMWRKKTINYLPKLLDILKYVLPQWLTNTTTSQYLELKQSVQVLGIECLNSFKPVSQSTRERSKINKSLKLLHFIDCFNSIMCLLKAKVVTLNDNLQNSLNQAIIHITSSYALNASRLVLFVEHLQHLQQLGFQIDNALQEIFYSQLLHQSPQAVQQLRDMLTTIWPKFISNAPIVTESTALFLPAASRCELTKTLAVAPQAKSKRKIKTYNPKNKKSIQALVAEAKANGNAYEYDHSANSKITKVNLLIAPVDILNGEYAVYANQNITISDQPIGKYVGKRLHEEENLDSKYIFKLDTEQDEFIDGDQVRDWTSFINHSETPNLYVKQSLIDGKMEILFYVGRNIKANEQLSFDYGNSYFDSMPFKPYYMHASDNEYSDKENYAAMHNLYESSLYQWDEETRQRLHLGDASLKWLLPKLMLSIYHNSDLESFTKLVSQHHNVDICAYAITADGIFADYPQQQHLTPLMLACYLGREAYVNVLIDNQADTNRLMLNQGYSSFTLAMLGLADDDTKLKIGETLLKYMPSPYYLDRNSLSLLHYIIVANQPKLAQQLLNFAKDENINLFSQMFNRQLDLATHADFDYCLQQGCFLLFENILLAAIEQPDVGINFIRSEMQAGNIFRTATLQSLDMTNRKQLLEILAKHPQTAELLNDRALKTLPHNTMSISKQHSLTAGFFAHSNSHTARERSAILAQRI